MNRSCLQSAKRDASQSVARQSHATSLPPLTPHEYQLQPRSCEHKHLALTLALQLACVFMLSVVLLPCFTGYCPLPPSLTAQTGYKNHNNVVRGRHTSVARAFINNATVYHITGFPGLYEVADPGAIVYGQLLEADVDDATYYSLLEELDHLEAYTTPGHPDNMYERVVRTVTVSKARSPRGAHPIAGTPTSLGPGLEGETEQVRAYVYVCLIDRVENKLTHVPSGDWGSWLASNKLEDVGDDWSEVLAAKAAEEGAPGKEEAAAVEVVA